MDDKTILAKHEFGERGLEDAAHLKGSPTNYAPGSRNLIPAGSRRSRVFRGLTAAGSGARRLFPIRDTYGGLDDIGGNQAAGSLFSWLEGLLAFIGYGQVSYQGTNLVDASSTAVQASSILQILVRWNGAYNHARSGPYQAGISQPSAPQVGLVDSPAAGGTPQTNGVYSVKIAWLRRTTGGRSRASATSATFSAVGKAGYAVIPEAPDGATDLIVFLPKRNFGGIGLHYRNPRANPWTGAEYKADEISRELTDVTVTNASPNIGSLTANFTNQDVGKLFKPKNADISVPAGTIIEQVLGSTSAVLSNNVTVNSGANPRTAEIISYQGGFERGILLNWTESDLIEETAWIEDYAPPPGSHAFPLDKVWAIVTGADGAQDANYQNPGTAIAFSLSNFPESYNPLHTLYLPDTVVDTLWRMTDSYVLIGLRNSIYACQFIESDAYTAPATLVTVLADRGIKSSKNWCVTNGGLYICVADGTLLRVRDGVVDFAFANPIKHLISTWAQENVVISGVPRNNLVKVSCGNSSVCYSEEENDWSTEIPLSDFAAGNVVSALSTQSECFITLENGGSRLLYKFDSGSAEGVVVAAIGQFEDASQSRGRAKIVREISALVETNNTSDKVYLTLHRNGARASVSDAAMTAGSDVLQSATARFRSSMVGWYVLVKGAAVSGGLLFARIKQYVSPTQVKLGTVTEDLSDSVQFNASNTVSGAFCIFAYFAACETINEEGVNFIPPRELYFPNFSSVAGGVVLTSADEDSVPLALEVQGNISSENTWTP
jgi:hypothetical protein